MPTDEKNTASFELSITVDPMGNWGDQTTGAVKDLIRDIREVLKSAATQIWQHCRNTQIEAIFTYHRNDHPHLDFKRDAKGRVRIGLHAAGRDYSNFAYQFAHEFCHALASQTNDYLKLWRNNTHKNQWFEECICETASIFALRGMAEAWKTCAPFQNWKSFAPNLADYVEKHVSKPVHRLPDHIDFMEWFHQHHSEFRSNPIANVSDRSKRDALREKFVIVASRLLPFFEKSPADWEAVTFLNLVPRDEQKPFETQLSDWLSVCPDHHRGFVGMIAGVFGISLPKF